MTSWVNPWTGVVQAWPLGQLPPGALGAGVLGTRPGSAPPQSLTAKHTPAGTLPPALYQALTGLTLQPSPPSAHDWVFDTGASSHMAGDAGMLSSTYPSFSRIVVGNGASLPVHCAGPSTLSTSSSPLHLHDVLVSPSLIKNLVSVRKLTRDNQVSVEFDPLVFSVKDLRSKEVILCSDRNGDLYPVSTSTTPSHSLHASVDLWHARLGHPGHPALRRLLHNLDFTCTPSQKHACTSCHLGKHVR